MNQLFLLAFVLIPVSSGFVINHGDKQNTTTNVSSEENGDLRVAIYQKNDGDTYFIKNEETGVKIKFSVSEITNEKEGIVRYIFKLKDHGKNYKYDYSTSNQQVRNEEGKHIKDADGSENLEVKGSYTYKDNKNGYYIQSYTADKNGFRTKVSFGPKVPFSIIVGIKSIPQHAPVDLKGIDGALLCSLAGGGCK